MAPAAHAPLTAARVVPSDPIYLVATSGTTGRPKCIPVSQDAAFLSYEWRDAYTPYTPDTRVGIIQTVKHLLIEELIAQAAVE